MNKFYIVIILFIAGLVLTNCRSEEEPEPIPLRPYQQVYDADNANIEEFMKTHTYTVINNPGSPNDQDVIFPAIAPDDTTTESIWDSPNLVTRPVALHGIEYNIYYLKLREGGGADLSNLKPQPTDADAVLAAYTGTYLYSRENDTIVPDPANPGGTISTKVTVVKSKLFETNLFPQNNFNLEGVIKGWREVFPQFRPGDFTQTPGNPTLYSDFGAGVMFIPSGLGYFNGVTPDGTIPAYSPLIFTFKLFEINRLDQDQDGIPTWLEDIDGNRYLNLEDNTDGDIAPDYLDLDDDGDNVLTKFEIRRPITETCQTITTYPYNGAAVDDPATPCINETQGIPDCFGDFTTSTRLRKYLDPNCQ